MILLERIGAKFVSFFLHRVCYNKKPRSIFLDTCGSKNVDLWREGKNNRNLLATVQCT